MCLTTTACRSLAHDYELLDAGRLIFVPHRDGRQFTIVPMTTVATAAAPGTLGMQFASGGCVMHVGSRRLGDKLIGKLSFPFYEMDGRIEPYRLMLETLGHANVAAAATAVVQVQQQLGNSVPDQ